MLDLSLALAFADELLDRRQRAEVIEREVGDVVALRQHRGAELEHLALDAEHLDEVAVSPEDLHPPHLGADDGADNGLTSHHDHRHRALPL